RKWVKKLKDMGYDEVVFTDPKDASKSTHSSYGAVAENLIKYGEKIYLAEQAVGKAEKLFNKKP
ncbi:MAG: hypothetical protein PHP21_05090, partial [Patescibacteria group bacterium]|nr:hypothetical protein [Patescibacteria group bacterium]